MAQDRTRGLKHIFLTNHGEAKPYTSTSRGRGSRSATRENSSEHGQKLLDDLNHAIEQGRQNIGSMEEQGFYLEFEISKDQVAILDRLENRQGNGEPISLASVKPSENSPDDMLSATVFVPVERQGHFARKIDEYIDQKTTNGVPKNEPLVAAIEGIRIGTTRSLFTGSADEFPEGDEQIWWEVWVRPNYSDMLTHTAENYNLEVRKYSVIKFLEREIILLRASLDEMDVLVQSTGVVAELRLAKDRPSIPDQPIEAQLELTKELIGRIKPAPSNAPAVTILDSGSTSGHPLLRTGIDVNDMYAYETNWDTQDIGEQWRGHGTEMSGLALFGNLNEVLGETGPIQLDHLLESVKILPDHGENSPNLYGSITRHAVSLPIIEHSTRNRVYCLATTSKPDTNGRPSSWSAAIDNLAK